MGERIIHPKFNVHENYKRVNIVNPYRHGAGGGPPVGGIDPDYQAVLDFASNNSIPLPSTQQQEIDNQLLIDYKATGGWVKDDAFFKFKGTANSAFKLIDWKRLLIAQAFGGLTWSDAGVKGNGTTGYIDPLFIPSQGVNYTKDNASIMLGVSDAGTAGSKALAGVFTGSSSNYIYLVPSNGTQCQAAINGFPGATTTYSSTGLTILNKVSPTNITLKYPPDLERALTVSSSALSPSKVYLLARNRPDTGSKDSYSDAGLSFAAFGANKVTQHNAIKLLLE